LWGSGRFIFYGSCRDPWGKIGETKNSFVKS